MQIVRRWWRTTLGKMFLILAGGVSSSVFCCVGLVVLVALINPSTPASRATAGTRTAIVQQVMGVQQATSNQALARTNLAAAVPSVTPLAVAPPAPPATATPLPTSTAVWPNGCIASWHESPLDRSETCPYKVIPNHFLKFSGCSWPKRVLYSACQPRFVGRLRYVAPSPVYPYTSRSGAFVV